VAVAGLIECLRSEDVGLRNESIEVMKHLPDEVSPIIQNLLVDKNVDVRIFAVNILESLRHPDVEAWLIEVIEHDQNVNVCATALDLLVEVGSKDAEQPISLPDEKIEARKKQEAQRQIELEEAKNQALQNGFEPRKIKTIDAHQ
jgi:HEAT repeat protein